MVENYERISELRRVPGIASLRGHIIKAVGRVPATLSAEGKPQTFPCRLLRPRDVAGDLDGGDCIGCSPPNTLCGKCDGLRGTARGRGARRRILCTCDLPLFSFFPNTDRGVRHSRARIAGQAALHQRPPPPKVLVQKC